MRVKGEKMVRSEVLSIRPWGAMTRKKHYRNYKVTLACGHSYSIGYGSDIAVMTFELQHNMKPKHKCYMCTRTATKKAREEENK
jgi:hypothetical protein